MDMYVIIPGFSHYRINRETKEVQSNRQGGKWRNLKIHSCGCYRLISDKKNAYNATPNRLLYAAQRGINPAKMSGDLFVVERDGELCLFDRRAFTIYTNKSRQKKTKEAVRDEYLQAIQFAQTVLTAYDTDDYTQVVTEIWKYENKMRSYMRMRNIAQNEEKQNELWMQTFDVTLDAIKNRRAYIVNLWGYLTRVVRTLHANIIKANKLITSLNENRKYAGTI